MRGEKQEERSRVSTRTAQKGEDISFSGFLLVRKHNRHYWLEAPGDQFSDELVCILFRGAVYDQGEFTGSGMVTGFMGAGIGAGYVHEIRAMFAGDESFGAVQGRELDESLEELFCIDGVFHRNGEGGVIGVAAQGVFSGEVAWGLDGEGVNRCFAELCAENGDAWFDGANFVFGVFNFFFTEQVGFVQEDDIAAFDLGPDVGEGLEENGQGSGVGEADDGDECVGGVQFAFLEHLFDDFWVGHAAGLDDHALHVRELGGEGGEDTDEFADEACAEDASAGNAEDVFCRGLECLGVDIGGGEFVDEEDKVASRMLFGDVAEEGGFTAAKESCDETEGDHTLPSSFARSRMALTKVSVSGICEMNVTLPSMQTVGMFFTPMRVM